MFVSLLFSGPFFQSPKETKHKINDAKVCVGLVLGWKRKVPDPAVNKMYLCSSALWIRWVTAISVWEEEEPYGPIVWVASFITAQTKTFMILKDSDYHTQTGKSHVQHCGVPVFFPCTALLGKRAKDCSCTRRNVSSKESLDSAGSSHDSCSHLRLDYGN